MSTKLKCNPYKDVIELSDALKDVISKHFNLSKGKATLTEEDKDYLLGIQDAGIESATELITAITQHKKVELYIE